MSENRSHTSASVDRRTFLTATGAAAVGGLAGCTTGGGGGGGPITFGQPALLSGDLQFIQPPVSAAADLAKQMINDAGGPLGRELEIVRKDTARTPSTAKSVFQQLVEQNDAKVINGFTSTVTKPLWDFFQSEEVPVVTMFAGSRFLDTRGGDGGTPDDLSDDEWYWRTTGADSQHTAGAAVHTGRTDATKVGAIHAKTAGSTTWAKAFLDAARVIDGVEVVDRVPVQAGKSSYRSDLESFYSNDIDVMGVAMGVPSATTVMKNWDSGGYGGNVMLANPLKNPQMVKNAGSIANSADGWVRTSVPAIAGDYASTYRSKFQDFVSNSDNYESDLSQNNWSASSYDAITVSALAVHAAGEASHDEIQKQIGRIGRPPGKKVSTFPEGKEALDNGNDVNYVGAQTAVNFNEFGDVFNQANVFELTGDGYTQTDTVKASRIRQNIESQA
jgi:ABC-type branched-subunit amino acid transport system substrate-binding protein